MTKYRIFQSNVGNQINGNIPISNEKVEKIIVWVKLFITTILIITPAVLKQRERQPMTPNIRGLIAVYAEAKKRPHTKSEATELSIAATTKK